MTDPSQYSTTPPPAAAPAYTPAPSTAFPPMPRNAAAAAGMASGYFGASNPSTLVVHAIALLVLSSLIIFIGSFFNVAVLSPTLRLLAALTGGLGTVVLFVGLVRFLSDAIRARP